MKTTSHALIIVAVGGLLLASCGNDTASSDAELRTILDAISNRDGVSSGPCHEPCISKALKAFDECVGQGGDREKCFGHAIHQFYRCADECKPPEPPACDERCQARAERVLAACVGKLGDEERCRVHAQEFLRRCLDECGRPPVCRSDDDCEPGESCQLEVCVNTCLDEDPVCIDSCIGVCVPDDCICPPIYTPVCGVDGVTYGNACEARCAGVEIAHEGECRDKCEPLACDLFCEFGFKLGPDGCPICECNEPCICTEEYDPVCGVDGVTYSNACLARCAGVEIAHEGECRRECESNADCAKDLICYPPSKTCQPPCEIACFRYDPVCGTDGVTYGCGEQDAWCHGVEVAYEGECRDECEPLACDLFCEFGFKLGPDGCPICECNPGPACCDEAEFPLCLIGTAECCGDGTWACPNGATGESQCKVSGGEVCETDCCDPKTEPGSNGNPICFEGHACCPDGTWSCSIGDGQTFPCGGELTTGPFAEACPVPIN